jgi:hypothetical protein
MQGRQDQLIFSRSFLIGTNGILSKLTVEIDEDIIGRFILNEREELSHGLSNIYIYVEEVGLAG